MLPARKMRADKKLYHPGLERHAEQTVLVLAKGQRRPSDHKPLVNYGEGWGPHCGAECDTGFGSGAEALWANLFLLHQIALPWVPAYQKTLRYWSRCPVFHRG